MSTTTQTAAPNTNGTIQTKPEFSPADYRKAQPLMTLQKMGKGIEKSIANALPSFMRNQAPALLRALYTECQKAPKLLDATPESLFGCTIAAAQMGLMLGGALGQCYLVPFKGKVNLIVGYKGYIQLVNRSGQTGVINAFTVYDKDQFSHEMGSSPKISHLPGKYETAADVQARKPVAFYATCLTKFGATFQVMTKAEAEHHRNRFAMARKGGEVVGPWVDHFDSMAMKTCIIKLCKYLPMSAELQTAIHYDEMADNGDGVDTSFLFREALQIEDSTPETKTENLANQLAEAKARTTVPSEVAAAGKELFPSDAEHEAALKRDEQRRQHAATA